MSTGEWGLVVSAEHASRRVPESLGSLGLHEAVFETHVAWDPGVAEVAGWLGDRFGVPCFLGEWSRLVADLNRSPGSPEAVPAIAFGVPVPANKDLPDAARAARLAEYHRPYWTAVREAVAESMKTHDKVLHLSVHSFTPEYEGQIREVELGVMMDPDRPLEREIADAWILSLTGAGFLSLENKPYDGRADALVTELRKVFSPERYAGMEVEISHKLLGRLDAVERALADAVAATLGRQNATR